MKKPSQKLTKQDNITVQVCHYYKHVIYYPFMSEKLFDLLQDAYFKQVSRVSVPAWEYDKMIQAYFNTLKN